MFEASDRSRSLPLALIHFLASELSAAPIREIARYKLSLSLQTLALLPLIPVNNRIFIS